MDSWNVFTTDERYQINNYDSTVIFNMRDVKDYRERIQRGGEMQHSLGVDVMSLNGQNPRMLGRYHSTYDLLTITRPPAYKVVFGESGEWVHTTINDLTDTEEVRLSSTRAGRRDAMRRSIRESQGYYGRPIFERVDPPTFSMNPNREED